MPSTRGKGWTKKAQENCMSAVNRHVLSEREASKRFGIPRRTLRNHLKTGSGEKRMDQKLLLSTEIEQKLIQRIFRYADIGLPLTSKMIQHYVFEYVDKNGLEHPFTTNEAGEKWFRLLMQRWPELRRRKA